MSEPVLYAETSAVLAWLFGEPAQASVLAALRGAAAVLSSRLTLVECHRSLQVAEQQRRISAADGNLCRRQLGQASRSWALLELTPAVCQRACAPFPREPLRTLDALHLASLLELHAREPRIQPLTLDRRVRDNALQLGFTPLP